VVEQPPAGREERVQGAGVDRELRPPHVLRHPDRGDGVVRAVGDLAVVLEPDLHPVLEARLRDPPAGEVGLLG
jgi:hypothetical protein